MTRSDLPLDRLVDPARRLTPNWNEVLVRAERFRRQRRLRLNRRMLPLVAAIAVLGAAGHAVAVDDSEVPFALGKPPPAPRLVVFSEADPAPPRMKASLARLDEGAPPGMETRVIASEARLISVPVGGRAETVRLAPTRKGGFCIDWPTNGGCWADRSEYLRKGLLIGGGYGGSPTVTTHLTGDVIAPGTRGVAVLYEDGSSDLVDLVWVSPPIDAGFFAHVVPAQKRASGHRVAALVALDADGEELAREEVTYRE